MGKQKPKTSIIARTSAKAVDSLYARICLRTSNLLANLALISELVVLPGGHTQGDLTFLPIFMSNALPRGKTLMSNTPSLVLNFV